LNQKKLNGIENLGAEGKKKKKGICGKQQMRIPIPPT